MRSDGGLGFQRIGRHLPRQGGGRILPLGTKACLNIVSEFGTVRVLINRFQPTLMPLRRRSKGLLEHELGVSRFSMGTAVNCSVCLWKRGGATYLIYGMQ